IDVDGAGATGANAAAELGTGEAQILAQHPQEGLVGIGIDGAGLAVHLEAGHRSPVDRAIHSTPATDVYRLDWAQPLRRSVARMSATLAAVSTGVPIKRRWSVGQCAECAGSAPAPT